MIAAIHCTDSMTQIEVYKTLYTSLAYVFPIANPPNFYLVFLSGNITEVDAQCIAHIPQVRYLCGPRDKSAVMEQIAMHISQTSPYQLELKCSESVQRRLKENNIQIII